MIRKARIHDAAAIAQCRKKAILAIDRQYYDEVQIGVWADAQTPGKYFAPIDAGEIFVAAEDASLYGFGWIKFDPAEIRAIYVAPEHQGRGLGRRLLRFLEDELFAVGVEEIILDASLNAQSFYAKYEYRAGEQQLLDVSGVLSPYVPMAKRIP